MPGLAFEGLEPYDGNLSRTVLRGLGVSNDPRLPGPADIWSLPYDITTCQIPEFD